MDLILKLVDIVLHLDKYLSLVVETYGVWTYLILFVIIFCETGLVVTPFLPGDSLLFMVGALAATGVFHFGFALFLLLAAAILGDSVNYEIGKFIGPKVFEKENRFIKREHLLKTQRFYEKHGAITIVLARFLPIIRTFAPFIAGVAKMSYRKFLMFNVIGALLWVVFFTTVGYFFGNMQIVQENFSLVVIAIIALSLVPITVGLFVKSKADSDNDA